MEIRSIAVEIVGHDPATVVFCSGELERALAKATAKLLNRCEVKKDNTGFRTITKPGTLFQQGGEL